MSYTDVYPISFDTVDINDVTLMIAFMYIFRYWFSDLFVPGARSVYKMDDMLLWKKQLFGKARPWKTLHSFY